jgi:hypothetical protein
MYVIFFKGIGRLADWLWWGETDVSELRPLRAYCSSLGDLRCGPLMVILTEAITPNLSAKALWQPPLLAGFLSAETSLAAASTVWRSCHPRHLWSEWEVGEGNENLVCPSLWDLKRSFTCRKILRHGTSGFTSHPKEGVLRILIALKNPSPLPGSQARTRNLWVQWQAH